MALIVGLVFIACTIVVIGVLLRIWAATLRIAVSLTNAVLGGREPDEDDFRGGPSRFDAIPQPKTLAGLRVPVPAVGYAILVNIGCAVASTVGQLGASIGAAFLLGMNDVDPTEPVGPNALAAGLGVIAAALAGNLFGTVLVLKMALPTTYLRAAVVVFWQLVIVALIGALVVGAVFVLGMAGGGLPVPTRPAGGGWVQ
jgi:hypothetical protein